MFIDKNHFLIGVVANIKKYLLSVYGASAPEYKQVNKISIKIIED
jgi:hypothetical protein